MRLYTTKQKCLFTRAFLRGRKYRSRARARRGTEVHVQCFALHSAVIIPQSKNVCLACVVEQRRKFARPQYRTIAINLRPIGAQSFGEELPSGGGPDAHRKVPQLRESAGRHRDPIGLPGPCDAGLLRLLYHILPVLKSGYRDFSLFIAPRNLKKDDFCLYFRSFLFAWGMVQ